MPLLEYKSFRELADEYHGPANAWHIVKTRIAELEDNENNIMELLEYPGASWEEVVGEVLKILKGSKPVEGK
jgi:hypothetical protein